MKSHLTTTLLSLSLLVAAPLFAQSTPHHQKGASSTQSSAKSGKLIEVTEKDAAWAAQAREQYALDVCLVSDEPLDSMGGAAEYIYRVDGQPDRLVRFCCSGCEEDFLQDPAAHLAKVDQAKKAGGKKPKAGTAKGHQH